MPKALTIASMAIALILLVIFGLDLIAGFPFGGLNKTMDIGFLIFSAGLGYLSWSTLRELN